MYCENGHSWKLRIGFHKGFSFLAVEDVAGEELIDPGLKWAGMDNLRYGAAIAAARSVRFEHGESPR
jgi:hypothetical protein